MKRLFLFLFLFSCYDEEFLKKELEKNNYKNIELKGYTAFQCKEKDLYTSIFYATKNDYSVKGIICCDRSKDCEIRLLK